MTLLTPDDLYWFNEGTHLRLYDKLGSRPAVQEGTAGVYFTVWAPNAHRVSVMGDFNGWSKQTDELSPLGSSGVWEGFLPGLQAKLRYKYHIESQFNAYEVDKSDPFAFRHEVPPQTASYVWPLDYTWSDQEWMNNRSRRNAIDAPISVYEVHLGSWMRPVQRPGEFYNYRELAPKLAEYVGRMGFTHVEFLPVMEHPFYGSWGYQCTGYFAPTSRYGTPQDFMALIDCLHQSGIGVILDWVPSHFPDNEFALSYFDGTHLYEHADPRQGVQPDWNSYVFNYGRPEVRSFLLSNALFWLEKYHADGLRVDAVASMLYLDYSRQPGQWIPNRFGGRENLEAIDFLRQLNTHVYRSFPDTLTVAEESTAWPMVSRPIYVGGLGFGYKWDMGWVHDTLQFMGLDPILRKFRHNQLTFRMAYAFSENFMLPLSHDEAVHGKGSLLEKMAGDDWQKRANLRLLLGYMFTLPAKKLLFMGGEFGQAGEWRHDGTLDWRLLDEPGHGGLQRWVRDLNRVYRQLPALHRFDCQPEGFQWIDCSDREKSVIAFLRQGLPGERRVVVVCNFTPVPRLNYRVGVPQGGRWEEVLNSDAAHFGGSGYGNLGGLEASPLPAHGYFSSLNLTLPPLGLVALKR